MRSVCLALALSLLAASEAQAKPKMYIAFQWHMHQPIYWPYETVVQTEDAARWTFDVLQIHSDRTGPYTAWPVDAVQQGVALPDFGAQVSFTGSLMENLNAIEAAARGFPGWKTDWTNSRSLVTTLGNSRVELTLIGYHHPLMPLIPSADRRLQIALHQQALTHNFGAPAKAPKGIFPPETAFAEHLIPDFAAAGVSWTLVDNIHFDRARLGYPYNSGSNLYPPNAADQRNSGGSVNWVSLQNIWAPTPVSAPWGYQPHWVEYVDPATGASSKIIAVPAARYEGNEDARGGYGAFLYGTVLSQYAQYNTDDAHPMLVVLHHDGDNYGGGTDAYYHANFANFVSWISANSAEYECTTVQDYLDRFPPDSADVIHVEPGSWSGADNGDPEFLKWNGDPATDGYSPDRNSWGVIVAAANRVHTAEAISPHTTLDAIQAGSGTETDKAWHYLLNGETSCYWYWDNTAGGLWDSHPARAANMAVQHADLVIATGADTVPPEIYLPQREPYNPGAIEWGTATQPSDFDVWTYVYDVSGLADVTLHYKVTSHGVVDASHLQYGSASAWQDVAMPATTIASRTSPMPTYKADEYRVKITGVSDSLVDYFVSATDTLGHLARSPIQHVYVGTSSGPNPTAKVGWSPPSPTPSDIVSIWGEKPGKLHWGVNGWTLPPTALQPAGSTPYDTKSVETPLTGPDAQGRYSIAIGPVGTAATVVDFVMHYTDGTWDNNGGSDYHIPIVEGVDGGTSNPGADSGATQPGADASSNPGADSGTPQPGADASSNPGADSGTPQPGADATVGPDTDAGQPPVGADAGIPVGSIDGAINLLADASSAQAGLDAGTPSAHGDAGASARVDAGHHQTEPPLMKFVGCGCSSGGDAAQGWIWLVLSIAGLLLPLRPARTRVRARE